MIVHHYGGPQAPLVVDRWQAATFYNQVLADRGYVVFSFDNRSATAKSKDIRESFTRPSVRCQRSPGFAIGYAMA